MNKPTNFDIPQSLETVWNALGCHRENSIPEGRDENYDNEWSDITTAMAWITEALGLEISTADDSTNGEYVEREDSDKARIEELESAIKAQIEANPRGSYPCLYYAVRA